MKKIQLSFLFFAAIQIFAFAQDTPTPVIPTKVRELGINFTNFNNLGLRYKTGGPKAVLRLTLLSINGGNVSRNPDSIGFKQSSFGTGFRVGFEKRKSITEKLGFYYGLDLISSYSNSKSNNNNSNAYIQVNNYWNASTGMGIVIGFNYFINQKFLVAAEVVPSVTYNYSKAHTESNGNSEDYTTKGINYGLNNFGANLTLAYRFGM